MLCSSWRLFWLRVRCKTQSWQPTNRYLPTEAEGYEGVMRGWEGHLVCFTAFVFCRLCGGNVRKMMADPGQIDREYTITEEENRKLDWAHAKLYSAHLSCLGHRPSGMVFMCSSDASILIFLNLELVTSCVIATLFDFSYIVIGIAALSIVAAFKSY